MELAKLNVFVSIGILRSYVDRLDFKSYRAAHKPRLTARHRKSRLRWAKEHLNWTEDQWRSVVSSDESRFCTKGSKRGKRVLREEGERYDERNIISTVKWGGGGATVWGCFWGGGFGPLEIIDTTSVDQEIYINILANRFRPWFTNVTAHQKRDFIFQEDGASCHIGGCARWWKEAHQIKGFEYWLAESHDLNPIEHVWNALERRIETKRSSVKDLEQLKAALREEWERMDDEFADRLVRSMKRRYEAVIKAKGGATEY
ncbi:hypothetical protein G6F55_010671 [Rhizopus delemar]|uniref:Transposase Tc1-like domain-containing protein n=3 Tax=Rhizopus TaxID=4842 RepID=I1BT69_RHIO9|nr:hypothetical protein RO3G_04104 [Rhizopus delemar RA 99-880]KAG1448387.1 hypothetical protein G6F55_010671 [Rhizopus delemar]KAG1534392.1 hypothetical protein G6F51_012122 [Rhizopus arrhizus]KAG1522309.1 hypothetical protein G6F52_005975 [Rhizopus delemar]KAG1539928.1 hypothetical protein G6F49_012256 [Rhizopus delemar]|eukprot:EIE79399.1 hypothetical protein RO3G_04104 [Rhizopus delemar RA 99-880]